MTAPLTSEAFAAMMHNAPAVPLCEASHRCGRAATHYLEARHHCLFPRGVTGRFLYPVCFGVAVATVANGHRGVVCPICGQYIPQHKYTELAGKVDEKL